MADTKRTVTVYINGKNVEASYKDIQTQQRAINAELKNMVIGSEAYNKKVKELSGLNRILREHGQAIKGAAQEAGGLSGVLGKLGSVGGLIGVGSIVAATDAIIDFSNKSYEAYKFAEESLTGVDQKLKSLGESAQFTTQELADAASDIQSYTKVGDEEILNGVTKTLLNFKQLSKETFLSAQKAAVDYAEGSGRSLEEASTAIGQALEQPEKAGRKLRAMNILLTQSEQDQIKALTDKGKIQEAQDIILGKINERYKDQAAALANTDTGKVEQFKNKWGDVLEVFGSIVASVRGKLAPILLYFADEIGKHLTFLIENGIKPLWSAFENLFSSISGGSSITETFSTIMIAVRGVLGATFTVIGWVVNGVASFIKYAKIAISTNTTLSAAFSALKTIVKGVGEFLSDLPALFSAIAAGAGVVWDMFTKRDFSKSIVGEMRKAFNATRAGMDKINKEVETKSGNTLLPGGGGGGGKPKKTGKTDAQKAAEKAQKDAEKALSDHLTRMQKLLDEAEENRRQSSMSDLKVKEDELQQKYQAEIDFAKKHNNGKNVLELEASLQDELYTLRAEYLDKNQALVDEKEEDARVSRLSEQQQEIEGIKSKYAEKIAASIQLENDLKDASLEQQAAAHEQTIALLNAQNDEITQKEIEQGVKVNDLKLKNQEEFAKALEGMKDLQLSVGDDLYTALDAQYARLLELAKQNGMDTYAITAEYESKKTALEQASQDARLAAYSNAFAKLGEAISGFTNEQSRDAIGWVLLQRGLALAQIAIDTARAISSLTASSSANPANAVTFGGAGAAQFIAGFAQILANIAKAKVLLTTPIPQKYMGGYSDVTGAQDGQRYRARYLGNSKTGMLPGTPSLVLASEKGPEYYVSNSSLRNPQVARLVQMIDNIERRKGIPQMSGGGYTQGGTSSAGYGSADVGLVKALSLLTRILQGGITASLPDRTIRDASERLTAMEQSSGGTLFRT